MIIAPIHSAISIVQVRGQYLRYRGYVFLIAYLAKNVYKMEKACVLRRHKAIRRNFPLSIEIQIFDRDFFPPSTYYAKWYLENTTALHFTNFTVFNRNEK